MGCFRACLAISCLALLAAAASPDNARADAKQDELLETFQVYVIQKMGRHEEAFGLWMKLAERGSRQGILNVAKMYAEGQGVAQDKAKALEWYLKGAEIGEADSMFQASLMLAEGAGGPAEKGRADALLVQAAEAGSPEAQVLLARKLADEGKTDEARALLEKADAAGSPDAGAVLARLDATGGPETPIEDNAPGESSNKVAGPPNVTQDNIIRRMLGEIDAAANARNADAMLDDLADNATVSVSLPNLPGAGGDMTVEAYRALWKGTLAEAEDGYSFTRNDIKLAQAAEDVKVESLIVERFPRAGAEATELRLKETLLIRFSRGQPVIHGVELVTAAAKSAQTAE